MAKDHKGRPSGQNKEEGRDIKPVMPAENLEGSENLGRESANDEDQLPENIKQRHPNRNTDKEDSTNAGGFRE
jgi:hypothetical protein